MWISGDNYMNYTYIVKCADSTLYTGWTNDLDKRIKAHNSGKGAKYTKTRRPVKLVYYEEHETKNEAMSREYAIKHLTRKEKEILIKGNGNLCGSWMVKGDMIKAGEFEKIKKLTREAKELAEKRARIKSGEILFNIPCVMRALFYRHVFEKSC